MKELLLFGLVVASLAMVTTVAAVLATRNTRRTVLALVLLGLLAATIKIFIFQQAPQWKDINPDSITYNLNAQAFVEHWRGNAVEGQGRNLKGLLALHAAGGHSAEWNPSDRLTYAGVIGSHEWLYPSYIALWYWLSEVTQAVVIWSNALWAAFFPAAAFGIAYSLGASRRVAWAAAGLALLDPSTGVNASWLLKDTLAGFLAMAALWAFMAYLREGGKGRFVVAVLTLGGLGGVRVVAFLGLAMAAGLISIWLLVRDKHCSRCLAVVGIVVFAWLINGLFGQAPNFSSTGGGVTKIISILAAPASTIFGGIAVLRSDSGDASADDSVLSWKKVLSERPVYAIARSLARTLFAPYPWSAISPGLSWMSFSELYYPGVFLWILCLPGVLVALTQTFRQNDLGYLLLVFFLAALVAAYTIWLGEWSTRQRVFALPAFFALAAIGWQQLLLWFDNLYRLQAKKKQLIK